MGHFWERAAGGGLFAGRGWVIEVGHLAGGVKKPGWEAAGVGHGWVKVGHGWVILGNDPPRVSYRKTVGFLLTIYYLLSRVG